MTRPQSIWQVAKPEAEVCQALAAKLGVSEIIASVLCNRGIDNEQEALAFINCALEDTPHPFLLKDMDIAIDYILAAIKRQEQIMVYGDYDVDGITSTTLLLDVLEALGCKPGFHIPDRLEEGYGLNSEALERAALQGYKLIITVDCGISAVKEVEHANSLGLKIIITDHHEPPSELPQAYAIINPKQQECNYPFKHLAGVGVAFKLAQGLILRSPGVAEPDLENKLLDLVALGTIADIVPILGENRTLVKHGLHNLSRSHRAGLRALIEVSGLEDKYLSPGHIGFTLAPRINATGRIGDATVAVQLLRTNDALGAREMAIYLDGENRERQELEGQILAEALEMLEDFNPEEDKVLVLAREGWHPGVIGIVSSRLVDRFYRPVLMIALDGEEGKGSGRSISGFNLYEALSHSEHLLERFGGHKQAAGLAVKKEHLQTLREELNLYASALDQGIYTPRLNIDAAVSLNQLNEQLIGQIKELEPFGFGNPSPVLAVEQLQLVEAREVGKDRNHLKIRVKDNVQSVDGIGFSLVRLLQDIQRDKPVKVAFTPELNEYKGKVSVQLQLKDMQNFNQHEEYLPITRYYAKFSGSELESLLGLAQGENQVVTENLDPKFPLIAAANQVLLTGLPSLVVYPWMQIIDKALHASVELFKTLDLRVQVNALDWVDNKANIVCITSEFFVQNVAKIREIGLGAIIIDTLQVLPEMAEIPVPVLRTSASEQIVNNCAPSRERLLSLYQALRQLAGPAGELDPKLVTQLIAKLGESWEFIDSGLEIFRELHIIRQENHGENRIFYFRAPQQKLNLFDSGLYTSAQQLLEEFTRLKGQCS
jgi:single-stranded-DNA-specific exonuclease RecJ